MPWEYCHCGKEPATFGRNSGDKAANVTEDGDPRSTPRKEILWAAENGRLRVVKRLVARDKRLLKAKDSDGYTALHRAAYNKHLNVVKYLLKAGANMIARTVDLWTPFHSACHWNSSECVALFLSCGFDVNDTTAGSNTGLHLAARNPKATETLEILLTHPEIDVYAKNEGNETAYDIAKRSGPNASLFEMTERIFNCVSEEWHPPPVDYMQEYQKLVERLVIDQEAADAEDAELEKQMTQKKT